ncbi:beta-galactosidase [Paenibacillus thailandensis]|uniref:Beta-galactosidase n=1 Tax=Paenibacillus thailandensis TaxID=393250 RepID=A0ABW5QW41_9BACL
MEIKPSEAVSFRPSGVWLEGVPRILMSASLFYFRIPRGLWKERMEQLKSFGYNAIDVYFPWNYHERSEGEWDFGGERDVTAFLAAAAETGLWVIARPGPYICSEWDGGALPAYLFAEEGMRLRDNDPLFLRHVERWFGRILPLLKAYEAGAGGTVIAVQLDNELDFYGCADPKGYMEALVRMAASAGLNVPLFACAGQGGLRQATGLEEGVMPTCNFYPNDKDPAFEEKALHYNGLLRSLGYPLLVTETNRSHYLLRRLLSCGAKLLGPYLQVSGTNFGLTNATNNWGKPLAFLTSDYDFGGMISPEGHIREEAYEGRLLARLIEAYGTDLAEAEAIGPDPELKMAGAAVSKAAIAGPYTLKLAGGGRLVFLTNLEDCDHAVSLAGLAGTADTGIAFTLKAGRSVALPVGLPLAAWGMEGSVRYSTAELFTATCGEGSAALFFHAEGSGQLALAIDEPLTAVSWQAQAEYRDGGLVVSFDVREGDAVCELVTKAGTTLRVIVMDRAKALLLEEARGDGTFSIGSMPRYPDRPEKAEAGWSLVRTAGTEPLSNRRLYRKALRRLERESVYRGFAWYEAELGVPAAAPVLGLLLKEAADVVSVYAGGRYAGTVTPGGGSVYVPLEGGPPEDGRCILQARVEIWGHSNFDDVRLPGLRLHAGKGITGAAAVTSVSDINGNWSVCRLSAGEPEERLLSEDTALWPVVGFGGWLSADHPAYELYRRKVKLSGDADSWIINIQNIRSICSLYVNGSKAGDINPFDPFLDITPYVAPGETAEIAVCVKRVLGWPAGRVVLYEGTEVRDWTICPADEDDLRVCADAVQGSGEETALPVILSPGETAWLYAETLNSDCGGGWRMHAAGEGVKLTVLLESIVVGRLWLGEAGRQAAMTGGSADTVYLPGVWYKEGAGKLAIWLEAVDRAREARLESLTFVPVGNRIQP